MSYSKGPWRWDGQNVVDCEGWSVAEVYARLCDGETEANAKLMASAPRMLEALKVALNRMEVVHWVDSVGDHGPDNVLEQEIEMVKKAIQQAEGGE
jgi:hypothetical protein